MPRRLPRVRFRVILLQMSRLQCDSSLHAATKVIYGCTAKRKRKRE
jgi:hypothetical protein